MRLGSPPGGLGQRAGAAGKVIVKASLTPRWRRSDANPQGSNGLREQERLLGKGKLCRAAPRRRERHVIRPRSVGAPRRNGELARARVVPRARPEPSRGARTPRTAPTKAWRPSSSRTASRPCGRAGAPDVVAFRGEQEPQERRTRVPGTIRRAQASRTGEGKRADTTRSSSEEEPNSRRGTHGASVPRVRHVEEDPETAKRCGGSAEANRALLDGQKKPL